MIHLTHCELTHDHVTRDHVTHDPRDPLPMTYKLRLLPIVDASVVPTAGM